MFENQKILNPGGDKMTSMKDIARECGVSVATVSKALNNHSDISTETRNRIQEVAKALNYFPNSSARALKTKRSYNIGVLYLDAENNGLKHERFAHLLDAFKVEAEKRGYDITFIGNSNQMTFYEHSRYRGVDGLLIACIDFYMPEVLELVKSNIPVITIDHSFDSCLSVVSDNAQGMKILTEYAVSRGHKKIAYVYGTNTRDGSMIYKEHGTLADLIAESSVTKNRVMGFYQTMEALELDVPEKYLKPIRYRNAKDAEKRTKELLSLVDRPTCIFYSDDMAAAGGIKAIRAAGLQVGKDISIAGYDGSEISKVLSPALTTIDQDDATTGRIAAERLIQAIEVPQRALPERVIVPPVLLKGESISKY